MKQAIKWMLVGSLLVATLRCAPEILSAPSKDGPGAFCFQSSDCLSQFCALEPYTDPPYGKCG